MFVEVLVGTTPTASAVLGVPAAMEREYPEQGRYLSLRVILPEHPRSEPLAVVLRWNSWRSAVLE